MRILLVEDDEVISNALANVLKSNGIICNVAKDVASGVSKCRSEEYDLVLLDVILPDKDGFSAINAIREVRKNIPIVMISALHSVEDRVKSLNLGADDFLRKPFHKNELLARISAVLRRQSTVFGSVIEIGRLSVNTWKKCVKNDEGKTIDFTSTEYTMIELMSKRVGSVVTKSYFINHLYYKEKEPEPKIIDVFMCKIRSKIQKAVGDWREYIHTAWGRGYILEYRPYKQQKADLPRKKPDEIEIDLKLRS